MNRLPAKLLLAAAVLTGIAAAVVSSSEPGTALIIGIFAMWLASAGATAWEPMAGGVLGGLFGAGVSAYLVTQHEAAMAGGSGSVCNIDETFNCDLVNTSAFSEVGGVPIAVFGAAFYAAVALISLLNWQKVDRFTGAPKLIAITGGIAVLGALYLAWASSTLGAWCLLCISTYGISLILLIAGVLGTRKAAAPEGVNQKEEGSDRSLMVAVVSGLLVLGMGVVSTTGQTQVPGSEGSEEGDISQLFSKVDGVVTLSGTEPCWGSPTAPYLLVEYADFECPHCGMSFPELKPLVAANPDLRVCFKNYPLSSDCNPNVGGPMHANACMAAAAATCAQEQGRFWELSGQMFANQNTLAPGDIFFMAKQLGIDETALRECMLSEETQAKIVAEGVAGGKAGLWATPTLFLKGVHPTDEWIQMEYGTEGASVLLAAARSGEALPAARPAERP
ncbi:MAG: protein-disulfide isomerase [Cognaticolwellia sp.]